MAPNVKPGQWFEAGQEGIGLPRLCVMRRGVWVYYKTNGSGPTKRMMAASVGEVFISLEEAIEANRVWQEAAKRLNSARDVIHAQFRDELRLLKNRHRVLNRPEAKASKSSQS